MSTLSTDHNRTTSSTPAARRDAYRRGTFALSAAGAFAVGCLAAAPALPAAASAASAAGSPVAPASWVTYEDASLVGGGRSVEILVTASCAPGTRPSPRTFGITITQGDGPDMVGGTTFQPITCDEQPHTALMRVTAMDGRRFQTGPALGDGWVSRDDGEKPGEGRLVKPVEIQ